MCRKVRLLTVVITLCFVCLVSAVLGRHYSSQDQAPIKPNQINGITFQCVKAYQQPAFQHPLLRNHEIQWQPVVIPREEKTRGSLDGVRPKSSVSQNSICPPYSIPIRTDIRRPEAVTPNSVRNSIYRFTRLEMVHYTSEKYRGGHAYISIDNPKCESGQASGASIWLESEDSDHKAAIKAGWIVNPDAYGDSLPHLSIYWTGDNYHTTGCYDLTCPGFVQVDNDMLLGSTFSGISTLGGDQFEEYYYMFQDKATLNWWLVCSQAGYEKYVGYWPKEIVPSLNGGATALYFGGSTMAQVGQPFPPMGFGQFPTGDRKYSIFFRQIQYVNASNYLIPPYPYGTKFDNAHPECYLMRYNDDRGRDMGHSIYLGGPGGSC